MDFQKVADAIGGASQGIKNLMFSSEIGQKVEDILSSINLEEEVGLKVIDEIGYVILGLKSRFNFSESLIQIGVNKDAAVQISKEVGESIFSELDKIKNQPSPQESRSTPAPQIQMPIVNTLATPKQERQSNVGSSFEQTMRNQVNAMRPAVAPKNLPIEPQAEHKIHNYTSPDPYREPIE